jgi:hypothetical protein
MSTPTSVHYSHLLRILLYLRGTIDRHLSSSFSSPQVHTYFDVTCGSDPLDFKSLSAYFVILGSSLIA